MMVFSVELQTGELIETGYRDQLYDALDSPTQKIPLTYDKYKELAKIERYCGKCGDLLQLWEFNVNVTNYYSSYYNPKGKRGRIRFRCFGCAQKEI